MATNYTITNIEIADAFYQSLKKAILQVKEWEKGATQSVAIGAIEQFSSEGHELAALNYDQYIKGVSPTLKMYLDEYRNITVSIIKYWMDLAKDANKSVTNAELKKEHDKYATLLEELTALAQATIGVRATEAAAPKKA